MPESYENSQLIDALGRKIWFWRSRPLEKKQGCGWEILSFASQNGESYQIGIFRFIFKPAGAWEIVWITAPSTAVTTTTEVFDEVSRLIKTGEWMDILLNK